MVLLQLPENILKEPSLKRLQFSGESDESGLPFYLNGFLLKVNNGSHLVEIKPSEKHSIHRMDSTDLPDWIFYSRHAIWLTEEDLPIKERADHGERVKRKLLMQIDSATEFVSKIENDDSLSKPVPS